MPVVRKKFGSISVQFGVPLDVKKYIDAKLARAEEQETFIPTSAIVEDLGYVITDALIENATCAMSHVVATILLVYRHGISKQELVRQADRLRLEILRRGGRVVGTQGRSPTAVVDRALELLHELVTMRRKDLIEPAITSVSVGIVKMILEAFSLILMSCAARAIPQHDRLRVLP